MKLSKRKSDISFIDPVTMQVRCTFNGCVDKFTVEGIEVQTLPNGNEFTTAYHECSECGQRIKARGDGKRAWKNHINRVASGKNEFYSPKAEQPTKYMSPYEQAMAKYKAKKSTSKDNK